MPWLAFHRKILIIAIILIPAHAMWTVAQMEAPEEAPEEALEEAQKEEREEVGGAK